MNLEIFTLCERWDRNPGDGRLNLYGLFNFSTLPSVPGSPSPALLYIQLRGDRREKNTHRLTLRLVNADGHEVFPPWEIIQGTIRWESHDHVLLSHFFDVAALVFPAYGQYAFHVEVGGEDMGVFPFRLDQPPSHPS